MGIPCCAPETHALWRRTVPWRVWSLRPCPGRRGVLGTPDWRTWAGVLSRRSRRGRTRLADIPRAVNQWPAGAVSTLRVRVCFSVGREVPGVGGKLICTAAGARGSGKCARGRKYRAPHAGGKVPQGRSGFGGVDGGRGAWSLPRAL